MAINLKTYTDHVFHFNILSFLILKYLYFLRYSVAQVSTCSQICVYQFSSTPCDVLYTEMSLIHWRIIHYKPQFSLGSQKWKNTILWDWHFAIDNKYQILSLQTNVDTFDAYSTSYNICRVFCKAFRPEMSQYDPIIHSFITLHLYSSLTC